MSKMGKRWLSIVCTVCLVLGCASGGADPATSRSTPAKKKKTTASSMPAGSAGNGEVSNFGNPDASTASPMSQPSTSTPMNGLSEETCARADAYVERIQPRVVFLVDSSSSMSEELGDGVSRWDALRSALLAKDGLVPSLQELVKFGLITYQGPRYTTCPALRYAAPAPKNVDLITKAFPDAPPDDSSTPTGAAMDWAIDNAFRDQTASVDVKVEPQYMIFATDGEPNGCANGTSGDPPLDFDSVLAAAHKAAGLNVKIFVISLAAAKGQFADHLQQVAKIGGSDMVYSPSNKGDLVDELKMIVGATISCEVTINAGKVGEGNECKGEVTLNSTKLDCNGDDGWELSDPTHILLKGKACDDFKLTPSAILTATFPCGVLQ